MSTLAKMATAQVMADTHDGLITHSADGSAVHFNITTWWAALVPPGMPHRDLLLEAANKMAWFASITIFWLGRIPKQALCSARQQGIFAFIAGFQHMLAWVHALVPQVGRLTVGSHHLQSSIAVLQSWVGRIGLELYGAQKDALWREISCEGDSEIHFLRTDLLVEFSRLQSVWPWVVDYAAIGLMENMSATVPVEALAWHRGDREVVLGLLKKLHAPEPLMVEVGVDLGRLSHGLLRGHQGLWLIGVDSYPGVYAGVPSDTRKDRMGSKGRYEAAKHTYSEFGARARLVRLPSVVAARSWVGELFDLAYIDAEHDYMSCSADIKAWSPLVRSGGIVAGDDYGSGTYGVVLAVHEQIPPGVTLNLAPHGIWWWIQP